VDYGRIISEFHVGLVTGIFCFLRRGWHIFKQFNELGCFCAGFCIHLSIMLILEALVFFGLKIMGEMASFTGLALEIKRTFFLPKIVRIFIA
jgi:hypothetical protein